MLSCTLLSLSLIKKTELNTAFISDCSLNCHTRSIFSQPWKHCVLPQCVCFTFVSDSVPYFLSPITFQLHFFFIFTHFRLSQESINQLILLRSTLLITDKKFNKSNKVEQTFTHIPNSSMQPHHYFSPNFI